MTLPVVIVIFRCFPTLPGVAVFVGNLDIGDDKRALWRRRLQFLISYSVAMLAFWMLEISTVVFIIYSFEYFLSGHMFPIGFMPVALFKHVLRLLPFPYELYFPISIFMGQVNGCSSLGRTC